MNITLNINDTCCSKCYKNSIDKTVTFTTQNQTVELQNNYFLNILTVSDTRFTILIQNGNCAIIRNILNGVATSISIPSKCTHIVTINNV